MVQFSRVIKFALVCSPLALAACGGHTPPPVVASAANATAEPDAGGGIYKVGTPYQVEGIWYYPAEDYAYVQEGVASWYGSDFHGKRTANGDRYNMDDLTAAHPTLPMPSVVKVTNLDNGKVLRVTVNDRGPFHSTRIIDVSKKAAQLLGFYEAGTARVRVEIDAQESITLKNIALKKRPPEMPQITASPRGVVTADNIAPLAPIPGSSIPPAAVKPVSVPPASIPAVAVPPPPSAKSPAQVPKASAPVKKTAPEAKTPGGIYVQAGAFSEEANARKLEQQLGELGVVHIVPTTVNNKKLYRVRLGPVADATMADALLKKIKTYGYNDAKVVRE